MKSSVSGMDYTFSVLNESELHRFVIVVYLRPQNPLKTNQVEIGRVTIPNHVVAEYQSSGSYSDFIGEHVQQITREYENSLKEKKLLDKTKNIHLVDENGVPYDKPLADLLKKSSLQELAAELGYLQSLGVNVDAALPTDLEVLVKKSAELKKAQMENKPNAKFLAAELDAMKQSYKESAIQYKVTPKYPPASKLPLPASYTTPLSWHDSDDLEDDLEHGSIPPPKQSPKPSRSARLVPSTQPEASSFFAETLRKFRDD